MVLRIGLYASNPKSMQNNSVMAQEVPEDSEAMGVSYVCNSQGWNLVAMGMQHPGLFKVDGTSTRLTDTPSDQASCGTAVIPAKSY